LKRTEVNQRTEVSRLRSAIKIYVFRVFNFLICILRLIPLVVIVRAAARAVVVIIIDDSLGKAFLAILAVVVLLLSICEDPEAIREGAKVGTDTSSGDTAGIVWVCLPFTSLDTIIAHQKGAALLLGVLQDAKMTLIVPQAAFTLLEVDGTSLSDLLDVKSQAIIDEELGISALDGLLHPRDGQQLLLGQRGPTLLPSIADGESLSLKSGGLVLGSHLVIVLGSILVGEGARHLGTQRDLK
jgi:hypothetical protein